ncbi:uncharacterized protein EURHEDRAFT_408024 [Aspergillus ruber CBS 135680]|uniref:Uncharacterized protein n=1 Tax=Aspergillus ruber (strain CBS 135680) TaxID=1388766 RepID=A0A017SPC2_ASPRC|nr:uncharacterized protein EURHEDRAFT_408024 [Aspergillus ruber CBS 135680]EYE98817.1 hypothetical protein EURHEDRAFT_408024 [Aspergillus ruber CBS 135680]
MSELNNVNSIATPKQGEFKPSVQPTNAPQEHGGHKPGVKATPGDYAPEFHAESHPPGTAPASNSFTPNTINEPGSQANNPNVERGHGKESVKTSAADTLQGSTSQDVYTGLGHPGSGQTSSELRHDGQSHRKHGGGGLEGVGASREPGFERYIPEQRGLERDQAHGGQRGDKGALGAENVQPDSA